MTHALPLAFVAFKRVVLTTLASCGLNVRVERSEQDWVCILDDGVKQIGIPPQKGLMTTEADVEGFAKAALTMALAEFAENDAAEPATVQ